MDCEYSINITGYLQGHFASLLINLSKYSRYHKYLHMS